MAMRPAGSRVGANVEYLTDPPFEIDYANPRRMADEMTDGLIERVGSIDGPAGLEWVAARLGLSLTDMSAPLKVRNAIIESLEARDGSQGALLLAAIAHVCPGVAAEMAAPALGRLRRRGVEADIPSGLGEYEFAQAQLERRTRRDFYSFGLRRPGQESVEIGFFSTKRGKQSGVLHSGVLTKPMREADAQEMMKRIEEPGVDRSKAMPISAEELTAALREASASTTGSDETVTFELWFALRALARALDVDFAILPVPRLYI